jgi:hypothetical protein
MAVGNINQSSGNFRVIRSQLIDPNFESPLESSFLQSQLPEFTIRNTRDV